MGVDDKLRVLDPDLLPRSSEADAVPDPTATAPLPPRRDEEGPALPAEVAEALFGGGEVDRVLPPDDDGVARRWDPETGRWVAPAGLSAPNTYAVEAQPGTPPPERPPPKRAIPLDAVAYGALVGLLLFLILMLTAYLLV